MLYSSHSTGALRVRVILLGILNTIKNLSVSSLPGIDADLGIPSEH